jgi:phosphate acetyltransferase
MLRSGLVDGMVAGADSSSARVIEAAMMTVGAATGITTPSSCFLMGFDAAEGRPEELLFADCALNIDPDPSQLADIAIASAETWQALQERPARVAFLSFSTHGSGKHPAVDRVVEALAIARIRRPDLLFEGELQADAALSERRPTRQRPLARRHRGRHRRYRDPDTGARGAWSAALRDRLISTRSFA